MGPEKFDITQFRLGPEVSANNHIVSDKKNIVRHGIIRPPEDFSSNAQKTAAANLAKHFNGKNVYLKEFPFGKDGKTPSQREALAQEYKRILYEFQVKTTQTRRTSPNGTVTYINVSEAKPGYKKLGEELGKEYDDEISNLQNAFSEFFDDYNTKINILTEEMLSSLQMQPTRETIRKLVNEHLNLVKTLTKAPLNEDTHHSKIISTLDDYTKSLDMLCSELTKRLMFQYHDFTINSKLKQPLIEHELNIQSNFCQNLREHGQKASAQLTSIRDDFQKKLEYIQPGRRKGLGCATAVATILHDSDLNMSNLGVDINNNTINIDGDCCLGDLQERLEYLLRREARGDTLDNFKHELQERCDILFAHKARGGTLDDFETATDIDTESILLFKLYKLLFEASEAHPKHINQQVNENLECFYEEMCKLEISGALNDHNVKKYRKLKVTANTLNLLPQIFYPDYQAHCWGEQVISLQNPASPENAPQLVELPVYFQHTQKDDDDNDLPLEIVTTYFKHLLMPAEAFEALANSISTDRRTVCKFLTMLLYAQMQARIAVLDYKPFQDFLKSPESDKFADQFRRKLLKHQLGPSHTFSDELDELAIKNAITERKSKLRLDAEPHNKNLKVLYKKCHSQFYRDIADQSQYIYEKTMINCVATGSISLLGIGSSLLIINLSLATLVALSVSSVLLTPMVGMLTYYVTAHSLSGPELQGIPADTAPAESTSLSESERQEILDDSDSHETLLARVERATELPINEEQYRSWDMDARNGYTMALDNRSKKAISNNQLSGADQPAREIGTQPIITNLTP